MSLCTTRLKKEYRELQQNPIPYIRAAPKETNVLEWHYVIVGQESTPYEGGYYHGTVIFPSDYPFKPPAIRMMTPSGRFKPGARLCLSMSDFHPESWNPMWSVSKILLGLYSFMLEEEVTNGSIESTEEEKRQLAKESLEFNTSNKIYCELFADLVELTQERMKLKEGGQCSEDTETAVQKACSEETAVDANPADPMVPGPPPSGSPSAVTTSTNTRCSTPDASPASSATPAPATPGIAIITAESTIEAGAGETRATKEAGELSPGVAAMSLSPSLPSPPRTATATSGSKPLSMMERLLASKGSAEPPTPPSGTSDAVTPLR